MNKLRYIDALRGIAVLGVVIIHCGLEGQPIDFRYITDFGKYGVQLFYMVSAFTLFLSNDARKEPNTRNFFIRRFFRIAPLYWLAVAYYTLETVLGVRFLFTGHAVNPINWYPIILNLTFTHGISPTYINYVYGGWSITVEMSFYVLLGLFLFKKIVNLNKAVLFFCFTVIISEILNKILAQNPSININEYLYYYLPNQLPVFALGICVYYIVKGDYKFNPALILSIVFYYAVFGMPQHIAFALGFGILIYILSQKEWKFLVNGFTVFLGKISFSLYLIHFAVINFLKGMKVINVTSNPSYSYFIRVLMVLIIASAISYVTYRLIELPAQRFGSRLIKKLSYSQVTKS